MFEELVPSVLYLSKSNKARTCWYHGPFRRSISAGFSLFSVLTLIMACTQAHTWRETEKEREREKHSWHIFATFQQHQGLIRLGTATWSKLAFPHWQQPKVPEENSPSRTIMNIKCTHKKSSDSEGHSKS